MQLSTKLPIQCMYFRHWHVDDTEVGVVVAKAHFTRGADGLFKGTRDVPELRMSDELEEGNPGFAALLHEQEIAPGKEATDLLVRGVARAPEGRPTGDWPVRVEIADRVSYGFQVRGPSEWRKQGRGWSLTEPELVQEVPLTYALAYGGTAPGQYDHAPEVFEMNPAGRGFVTDQLLEKGEPIPAPQIGELAEFMGGEPRKEMTVHGFGPIAKAWLPRRADAGTFDEEWKQTRHPRMPKDYTLKFWNSAPLPLQIDPMLDGHEMVSLRGFSHATDPLAVKLPGVFLSVDVRGEEYTKTVPLDLDTVEIDVTDADPEGHTLTLLWRGLITGPERFNAGDIIAEKVEVSP